MMIIRPLDNQQQLAEFINRQPLQPFLQSWAWGDFQESIGRPIWRLGVFEGDALVGCALVVEHELMLGKTYLYCPRGPLAATPEALTMLLEEIKKLGRTSNAMYVKADLGLYTFSFDVDGFVEGYIQGTTLQPRQTLVIDTSRTSDEILAGVHQKTRYNIRLAEKKNVVVRWGSSDKDVQEFLRLMHITAKRQSIRLHSDQYYQKLFSFMHRAGMAEFAIGEVDGQAHVAHMVFWHGQTATYLHGGSDDARKEMMIPYLVQWRTIQRAHEKGVHDYDLWGIAPDNASEHKWAGVTRFKRGFNGREVVFPPALNAVLQPQWYHTYRLAKRFRGGVDA